jgi:hypothetical protein
MDEIARGFDDLACADKIVNTGLPNVPNSGSSAENPDAMGIRHD